MKQEAVPQKEEKSRENQKDQGTGKNPPKKKGRKKKEAGFTYSLDEELIAEEKQYDGFYAIETNLDDDVPEILAISRGRWEIEESFRIMKNDFRSRPAYLSRSDRIKAHFMTCFIALLVYRILERKLGNKYTCDEIVSTLVSMRVKAEKDIGYSPAYTRTDLTDALHEAAGFRTDYEITRKKAMKGIIRRSKQR